MVFPGKEGVSFPTRHYNGVPSRSYAIDIGVVGPEPLIGAGSQLGLVNSINNRA